MKCLASPILRIFILFPVQFGKNFHYFIISYWGNFLMICGQFNQFVKDPEILASLCILWWFNIAIFNIEMIYNFDMDFSLQWLLFL